MSSRTEVVENESGSSLFSKFHNAVASAQGIFFTTFKAQLYSIGNTLITIFGATLIFGAIGLCFYAVKLVIFLLFDIGAVDYPTAIDRFGG